jgi:LuxR family maltose regulon positive regulatory protein
MVCVWRARLEDAEGWLPRAQRALTSELEPAEGSLLHRSRGLVELLRGRDEEALVAFRAAVRLEELLALPHVLAAGTSALELQAMLRLGQAERVGQLLDELDDDLREHAEMRKVTALLELARDDPEAATTALGPVIDGSVKAVHVGRFLEALLIEAIARDALPDVGASTRALEGALDLVEHDGLVLPFLLHPAPEPLERHRRQRTAHASLISEITSLLAGKGPTPDKPKPLSESELRVLRYLPTNLSAPEIARELYLGVSTVKTHIQHVCAKLEVHRRAEAVEQARALGFLAPGSLTRR